MKKIVVSLGGIILGVIAVAVVVFTILPGLNGGYAIEAAGTTYDEKGQNQVFSKEAVYNPSGLDGKPVIEDKGSSIPLNDGRVVFLDNSNIQLLSNSVVIVNKNTLMDLESKSIISQKNDVFEVSKKDSDKKMTQLPRGSIVKLNKGQYLVLDSATMENGADYSKKYDADALLVSVDKNKKVRIFSNGSYDETISESMYLKLKNSTCKFQLKDEELVCSDEANNVDLANITVKFDDAGEDKSSKLAEQAEKEKQAASKEVEAEKEKEEANGTGSGNGAGTGAGESQAAKENEKASEDLPEIIKIEESGYQIPIIDTQTKAHLNSLTGSLRISDAESRLTSLAVVLRDANGNEVMRKGVPIKAEEDSFTFKDLEYQKDYILSVEGAYKGEGNKSVDAVFYRKMVNFNELLFDAAVVETTSDAITLSFKGDFSELSTVVVNYSENNGTQSAGSNHSIDVSGFQSNNVDNRVTIPNLKSNTSYLLTYADVKTKGNVSVTSNWYAVGNTRKKLAEVGVTQASYDSSRQIFKLNIDPFADADDSVTSVRYVAYLKDDFTTNGTNAVEQLSTIQTADEKFKDLSVTRTSGMQTGDYIFVAFVSGNDTQETYVLEATPSNSVSINADKTMPTAIFELKKATTSELRVKHIISDVDNTLVFDGVVNPTVEAYKIDANGDITGSAVKSIIINNRTDLTMTQLFDGLNADTDYRIVARGQANLDDGQGEVNFEAISDVFRTKPIVALTATFTEIDVTANSATINTKIVDEDKSLVSAKIQITNVDDSTSTTINLNKEQLQAFFDASGDTRDILDLDATTNYHIEIIEAKDSGDNIIPVNGSIDVLTEQIKEKPSVEFVGFDPKASTIEMTYKVKDTDAAFIFAPNDYPVFEIYEVLAGGALANEPTDSVQMTQMNAEQQKIRFKNLTKLTNYKVLFKGSYDINVFGGIVTQDKIGESDVVTTTDVQDITATITEKTIEYTSIDFNVKLSTYAKELTSGKISIYEKLGSTAIDTIDISADLNALTSTNGIDYQFTGLKKATAYIIKIESLSDGTNISKVIGGTFEFITKKEKEKPVATMEWNKGSSTDTQLNVLYEVKDIDSILEVSSSASTLKAHLYEVDATGSLAGLIDTKTITDRANLTGEFIYTGLAPNKTYKVVVKGTYDQQNGEGVQTDIIIGTSETMTTRNALDVQAYFSEVSKTTTSAKIGIVLIDNISAFAGGTASVQVYDIDGVPVGTPIVLSADQMTKLSLGTRIDVDVTGLTEDTNYSIKFLEAKSQTNQDLNVRGFLDFKTDKIKVKPTVLFTETQPGASKVATTFSVVDIDQTLVVTDTFKTVAQLQLKDGNGDYNNVNGKAVEYKTLAELSNRKLTFTGLENNKDYRIVLSSWYTLTNAAGMVNEPIGELDFTTKVNDVINASIEVNPDLTSMIAGNTTIQFDSHSNTLKSGKLLLTSKDGVPVGNPIDVSEADFAELSTSGKVYAWGMDTIGVDLESNVQYNVVFLDVLDDGDNPITIISTPKGFKTRKASHKSDIVFTSIKREANVTKLEAIIGLLPDQPFIDKDKAIKQIDYNLCDGENMDNCLDTIVVTNADDLDKPVKFDLSKAGLGVGRSYIVRSVVRYNDNYTDGQTDHFSLQQEVPRELPIVKYEFVSRNAASTVVKVNVNDSDQSIAGNLELIAGGTSYPLQVGDNTITVANTATTFKTESDIKQIDAAAVDNDVELLTTTLQAAVNDVPELQTNMTYNKDSYSLKYKPTVLTALGSIFAKYNVIEDASSEVVINKTASGSSIFAEQNVSLPTDNIFFGQTYEFTSETNVAYTQHGMNNTFDGTYILSLNNGTPTTSYVTTVQSVVGTHPNVANGSVYKIVGGSYKASTGNYTGVKLVNEVTGKSLGVDMGRLVESDVAAAVDFQLQADGSYKVLVDGTYASFENGTVTLSGAISSNVNLYKVDTKAFTTNDEVEIEALKKPEFAVSNLQILDVSISFNYTGTDPDTTLLRDDLTKKYDTKIILENLSDNTKQEITLEYLSRNGMTFTGLKSNQEYKMTIEGNYNLKDGNPDIEGEVFYENTFTTAITLPTATKSTYLWDSNPYGKVDTTATLTYADPGNVAKAIEYVYYKAPTGSYDLNNLTIMKMILDQNQGNKEAKEFSFPVADNASEQGVSLPMFNTKWNEPRNYGINNYLVAAYITTDVPGAQRILVNVNKVNVTKPVLVKSVFTNTSSTETTASTRFSFEDPNLVLGNGTRAFEVSLLKKNASGTYVLVPGSVRQETRTTASGFIDVNYSSLDPNTNYRISVKSTTYNDLVLIGSRDFVVDITTLNQYITSSVVKTSVTSGKLTANVDDIVAKDAVIQKMEMKLYRWADESAMAGPATLVDTKPIPAPFPANAANTFNITNSGLYYVEFVVTYAKNSGGGSDTYSRQSIVREVGTTRLALDVERSAKTLKLSDSIKNQDISEVIVKDQDDVIATIAYEDFANGKQEVELGNATEVSVEVKDIAGDVTTLYTSDDVEGQITATSIGKNKTMLKSGDFINKKDILKVEVTRSLDWWESVQSFFGSDFSYKSDIVAGDLNEGIILPYNLNDVEIKVTDKDGNEIHVAGGK